MRRYLCVYLPRWSVNLLRKKSGAGDTDSGTLIVTKRSGHFVVERMCEIAERIGLKPGGSLALAQAFMPKALVGEFDFNYEMEKLQELATWSLRFTPLVGIDTELLAHYKKGTEISPLFNGLVLDVTGTERLHKGEEKLSSRIFERFRRAKIEAKIAITPTIGASWALSRFAPARLSILRSRDEIKEAISPLPISALRLSPSTEGGLTQVGIYRVEDVLALPRKSLPIRFGVELLTRIDQAFGSIQESLTTIHPPTDWIVSKNFEVPLSRHESIQRAILSLLSKLLARLSTSAMRSSQFTIRVEGRDDLGSTFSILREFSLHAATKSETHLISVLSPLIERIAPPGPISTITVQATQVERAYALQNGFEGSEENEVARDELLNTFVVRLGKERVSKVGFHQSYIPERSYRYVPIVVEGGGPEAHSLHVVGDRPSYIFHIPEEIEAIALLPDKAPSWIRWRSSSYKIIKGSYPERIAPEWWDPSTSLERDYFKVQEEEGKWFWVYRENPSQRWFIHGLWI